jgi:gag-polypeptide of LTR copia-type
MSSPTGTLSINPAYVNWHRQDHLLLGWIQSSLTESVQAQVVSCNTTADLWINLQQSFSSFSCAQLVELRRQLQTITKGAATCTEFLQKIRKVVDELAFIGFPISDEDLTLVILSDLGSDYNSFYAAITTSCRYESIPFTDLHGLLLRHETLLQPQYTSATTLHSTSPLATFLSCPSFLNNFHPKSSTC